MNTASRAAGWLTGPIEQALTCPKGHRIHGAGLVHSSQLLVCPHRATRGGPPCGALIWALRTHSGAVFVASVTRDEIVELKTHRSIYDTLRYLGAPLWEHAA